MLYKIGDFSRIGRVSIRRLRYCDEINLLWIILEFAGNLVMVHAGLPGVLKECIIYRVADRRR